MREVEIKARVKDSDGVKTAIEDSCGKGRTVSKLDCYFHQPMANESAFRLRNNNGALEFTAKKKHRDGNGESNMEYEFCSELSQFQKAVEFFRCLGYEEYYRKEKTGWDWTFEGAHLELLKVNDLGYFLEIETILEEDASPDELESALSHVTELVLRFGCGEEDICPQTYKSMILKEN